MTERQLRAGTHSERVRSLARDAGFDHCGIATATFLEAEAPRLERWLKQGMHGTMAYMEQHFDKRLDPRQLVPGARSVISLLVNYHSRETQPPDVPRISTYAYSRKDYHRVIKDMLFNLVQRMQEELGHFDG
ncbi:MAG: DUF1730 domain-containing protein, partial [Flavobacteriales bacterium]|nr:DUF1730 domain-containing protein [Flavobacteriales bacterium]